MFKKIKDKWNQLDDGTKKAVKAGLVVTACAGSMYLGAHIVNAWYKYEEKHKFDDYPRYGIEFGKDEDLNMYYLKIGRAAIDRSAVKYLAGVTLGSIEETKEFFNECQDYISKKEENVNKI